MDVQALFEQVQEQLPAVSAWAYVLIWAWSDMSNRMAQSPREPRFDLVTFPHSKVPLFTPEQAKALEAAWPKAERAQERHAETQAGGKLSFPPTPTQLQEIGQTLASAQVDPEIFSIDKQYSSITGALDAVDAQLQEFSKKYGFIALESVAPDPKFIIPTVPPIPILIPVRLIMPMVHAMLEILRVGSTLIPGTGFLRNPMTILVFLLELARGNLYGSLFTLLGLAGKFPLYAGIIMKVLHSAYTMIAPDIRGELRDVVFKSSKSFVVGFMVWVFSILSPELIRKPIVEVLDRIREMADTFNEQMTVAEQKATAALKGLGVMQFPKIAGEYIPSIGDLYVIQTLVHNPRIYCDPQVVPLIVEMRAIPPLALFFDLLLIPTPGSPQFAEACASVKTLSQEFAPKFVPAAPAAPSSDK